MKKQILQLACEAYILQFTGENVRVSSIVEMSDELIMAKGRGFETPISRVSLSGFLLSIVFDEKL